MSDTAEKHVRRGARTTGLKKNILSNWVLFGYTAVVGFFLTPFIVRSLGDTMYGVWGLLTSVVGYLGLLDVGVRLAVTRFVAGSVATGDHERASRYASTSVALFGLAGITAIALSAGLSAGVHVFFDIPEQVLRTARLVLLLGGSTVALTLMAGTFGGVVVACERFDLPNLTELAIQSARALMVVAILSSGGGLVGLAVLHLGLAFARLVINILLARHVYPELRISPALIGSTERADIFRFGVSLTALTIASTLAFSTDSMVIATFLPVAMITPFAIGASLTQYARSIVGGISYVITPRSSRLQGVGDAEGIRRMVLAAGRGATLVLLPITITFLIRGTSFIELWMGEEYAVASSRVLWILSIALSFAAAREIASSSLVGLGRHAGLVPAMLVEGVVNVALSVFLVRRWSIYGVAWGTMLPSLAISLIFIPWYLRRTVGIRRREAAIQFWLRPALAMVGFAAGSYLVERLWPADNLLLFFTQVALTLPLAVAGAWWFSMEPREQENARQLLRRLWIGRKRFASLQDDEALQPAGRSRSKVAAEPAEMGAAAG